MMHVLFAGGFEDRDYLERHTLGHEALRERAAEWTPERTASRHRAAGRDHRVARRALRHARTPRSFA